MLDTMDLERERGITIKAHPVRLQLHRRRTASTYILNLIDTPGPRRLRLRGHAVAGRLRGRAAGRRRLAGRRGADAGQRLPGRRQRPRDHPGHQQDRPAERRSPTRRARQIEEIIGLDGAGAILASAKEGIGVREILEAVVARVPPPDGDPDAPLKALIFDSLVRPLPRRRRRGARASTARCSRSMKIRFMATAQDYEVEQLGVFTPKPLRAGRDRRRRGRLHRLRHQARRRRARSATPSPRPRGPTAEPFPGFKALKPMVFAGLYPVESHALRRAARSAREAAAQRLGVLLRARDVGGARLRLPLRLPRPAAHGDRPGAARARVQHGPDHDGARRALPRDHDRRRGAARSTARPSCPTPGTIADARGAGDHRDDPDAGRVRRRDPAALPGQARRAEGARVQGRRTACSSPTSCRSPRSCSTSTTG